MWGVIAKGLSDIGSGLIQSDAAGDAAEMQAQAAQQANQLQEAMWRQQLKANAPWQQAGRGALNGAGGLMKRLNPTTYQFNQDERNAFQTNRMNQVRNEFKGKTDAEYQSMVDASWKQHEAAMNQQQMENGEYEVDPELTRSFTMADYQQDPGFDFRMKQGQKALERSAAARGGLRSGATLKALTQYGQDFASNEYGKAYDRFNQNQGNRFNRLSSIAGFGSTANAQNAAASQNYANQSGANTMASGDSQAAARISQGKIWGDTLSNLGKMGMDYYNKGKA